MLRIYVTRYVVAFWIVAAVFAGSANAQSLLQRLQGSWVNQTTGATIEFRGGSNVNLSNKGFGRYTEVIDYGANIVIVGDNFSCYYFVNFLSNDQRSNWVFKNGASDCPKGIFDRLSDSGMSTSPGSNDVGVGNASQLSTRKFTDLQVQTAQGRLEIGGRPVYYDLCLFERGTDQLSCGQDAAVAFCKIQGYVRVNSFTYDFSTDDMWTYKIGDRASGFGGRSADREGRQPRQYFTMVECAR